MRSPETSASSPRSIRMPASSMADRVQLLQVLLNLTMNAFEALTRRSAPRPAVSSVRADQAEDGKICVSVRDSGPGFPGRNRRSTVRAFLLDQNGRDRHGPGHRPQHHRSARRYALRRKTARKAARSSRFACRKPPRRNPRPPNFRSIRHAREQDTNPEISGAC